MRHKHKEMRYSAIDLGSLNPSFDSEKPVIVESVPSPLSSLSHLSFQQPDLGFEQETRLRKRSSLHVS